MFQLFGIFHLIRDIDFDSQGNVYVTDFNKSQFVVFSEDGQYLRHFGQSGKGKGELSGPQGLCVSGEYVYVTQWGNNRVSIFTHLVSLSIPLGSGDLAEVN